MGNEQSSLGGEQDLNCDYGFRVLHTNKDCLIPIRSYFDFIIGINNRQFNNNDSLNEWEMFITEVKLCLNSRSWSLIVWNSLTRKIRTISIPPPEAVNSITNNPVNISNQPVTPNNNKNNNTDPAEQNKKDENQNNRTLGIKTQWTKLSISTSIFRVLDPQPGSPAYNAGLCSNDDYIIGVNDCIPPYPNENSQLANIITRHQDDFNNPLKFHVYNAPSDIIREVFLVPKEWGGKGLLGCGLGSGVLHSLPIVESAPGEGDILYEAPLFDDDLSNKNLINHTNDTTNISNNNTNNDSNNNTSNNANNNNNDTNNNNINNNILFTPAEQAVNLLPIPNTNHLNSFSDIKHDNDSFSKESDNSTLDNSQIQNDCQPQQLQSVETPIVSRWKKMQKKHDKLKTSNITLNLDSYFAEAEKP